MSKSGLFAHFRSKEQLQLQTLDHAADAFTDVVVRPTLKAPRGERRIRELFDRWLDWEAETLAGGCVFAAASIEYDDQPGAMHDALVRQQRDWAEFVATVGRHGRLRGRVPLPTSTPGSSPSRCSRLMFGYRHAGRLLGDPEALDRTRAAFEQLLDSSR